MVSKLIKAGELFSFNLTASAYSFPWEFDGVRLRQVIDGIPVVIEERNGYLEYRGNIEEEKLRDYLGLDENITPFVEKACKDPILKSAIDFLKGLHIRKSPLFNAIIIAVAQQNASFRQGWRMVGRLVVKVNRRVSGYLTFPEPIDIYRASDATLKECGFGYRAKTIREVAKFFLDGGHVKLNILNADEAVEKLTEIKGVGLYSASWAILFSRRAYSVFPFDRWFDRLLREAYKTDTPRVEALKKWGKWAGLFAFYTTVATDALPIRKTLENLRSSKIQPDPNSKKPTPLTLWKFKELFFS